jgi:hypothetical protein
MTDAWPTIACGPLGGVLTEVIGMLGAGGVENFQYPIAAITPKGKPISASGSSAHARRPQFANVAPPANLLLMLHSVVDALKRRA